ncbi:MAG TPA: carboxyl transferase domain-containing protein [Gammaproteobacteria bacterium]|nr:carboxyl transferase domain-containing protein [Gammaproteobacteria bacterium]
MIRRCLIANRGEIAIRIARSCADLGIESVAVHGADDADALHVARADRAAALPGRGARAYLDGAAVLEAARAQACDAVHPGYGFLAEHAGFAAAVEAAGLAWVGPTPAQLELFGDKIAARALAARCEVPVLQGSPAVATREEIDAFVATLGAGGIAVIKAAAGGGGRGMQVLLPGIDVATALARCAEEARAAFGDGTLYAERFIAAARHVEVQILGDGRGQVTHLWERDCSLQRRHQKLIEIAPAPALPAALRARLLDCACRMAAAVDYRGLGTFEYLVDVATDGYWFIEANPRLQVEHTVTEEVLGLDLVALQFAIAAGRTLAELDLAAPPPAPRDAAIELRVNTETLGADGLARAAGGTIARYEAPGGPGVRVDSAAYAGYAPNPSFDPLLAKIVVRASGLDFAALARRAERAAAECRIEGIDTNLPLLRALLRHPEVQAARMTTRFVEREAAALQAAAAALAPAPALAAASTQSTRRARMTPPGAEAVVAPMRGSVVSIDVEVGQAVARGTALAVLEAMKMHHLIEAPCAGIVVGIAAAVGETLADGEAVIFLQADAAANEAGPDAQSLDLAASRADLDEVIARHALTLDANRPDAVAKRRKTGSRTARENVEDLCDPGSFVEYGALIVAAQRRRRSLEDLQRNTPADGLIGGIGTVNAAEFPGVDTRCMVLAYDYTVLAGTQGVFNHKKKDRLFGLAQEWKLPVVFYTEGGGGRPGDVDVDDIISAWLDLPTFSTWPQLSGLAPRIAVNSGRCFAGNAVIFGCADITIATASSNIGLAGPAMIEGGGLGKFAPEDIGPIEVQTANGVVDLAVADEAEGAAAARRLLGYFQGRTAHWTCADQRALRHCVPENRLRVYEVRTVIDTLADAGSVLELRRDYGVGIVTAFIRIEGRPFGLIANDPRHLGGAIDGPGAEKAARFLQLCDAYGLPVVSLCDTPGFMVGPDSEKTAAVRRGSRLLVVGANLSVPLFAVVLRKGYGLGAQAMCGGSFHRPLFTISWPTGEFGPMGLEGAVQLGFRKELDAETDPRAKQALYERLLAKMYSDGKAVNVASQLEIDAVIDPAETRAWLLRGLKSAGPIARGAHSYVDVW